jgi:hypothetical protein
VRGSRADDSASDRAGRGSPGLYRLWAIASSGLCIGLAAYILAGEGDRAARRGEPPEGPAPLPPELRGLPREWISERNGPDHTGHAVVLDLEVARELIVERCRHRGYFDEERGEPVPEQWSFCESDVSGRVVEAESGRLAVRDREARELDVPMEVSRATPAPRLALEIEGARLELVPGSKNDLFQRLEAEPAIRAGKERSLQHLLELETERRRAR